MSRILGTGWVTPLGRDVDEVCGKVLNQEKIAPSEIGEGWPVLRIPAELVADAAAVPRMRRSSVISHYSVAAARDAVTAAGLGDAELARCALVFASSDGGVVYTRRFYEDIVRSGRGAGSPLLFPETVYNAPASHVAAALNLTGELLTVVGDASAGLAAIHTGCELLADPEIDFCLIVAAQECDWASAEAYGRWGLIGGGKQPQAAPFSEGAAALILGRGEGTRIAFSHPGFSYSTNAEAGTALRKVLASVPPDLRPGTVISGGTGGAFDAIEIAEIENVFTGCRRIAPKLTLGETLAVSALHHTILGDHLIRHGEKHPVLVPAVGFNGELGALILTEKQG